MCLQRKEPKTRTPPTRHFLAALKAFIKSFDSSFFFLHAETHLWQHVSPVSAAPSDLGLLLARYKDIIRHGVLDQKKVGKKRENERKGKVQQRRNT